MASPSSNLIKVNTDGLLKNNPGLSACDGRFRDHHGTFLVSFTMLLDIDPRFMLNLWQLFLLFNKFGYGFGINFGLNATSCP